MRIQMKTIFRALCLLSSGAVFSFIMLRNDFLGQYRMLRHEYAEKKREVATLEHEVQALKEELACWQHDDFYLEKMAREELLLGKADERMYMID